MFTEDNPIHRPEVIEKVSGDNHCSRKIKEPWRLYNAGKTDRTYFMWKSADILYDAWLPLQCSKYKLENTTGIFVTHAVTKHFKNGWIPLLDEEWIKDFK